MKLHKQMYYFNIQETVPTKEDGDWNGDVLVFDVCSGWFTCHWSKVTNLKGFSGYTHWMQKPKAPDMNDPDF